MFARAPLWSLVLALVSSIGCGRAHTRSEPGSNVETVGGSGGSGASAYLAIADEHLFFVDHARGAARVAPASTLRARTLASASVYAYPFVAADPSGLYWLEVRGGLSVVTARMDEHASRLAAQGDIGPVGLAVDAGLLYFARQEPNGERIELLEITLASGQTRVLTECGGVLGIAVDEDTLFATTCRSEGGVWRIARAGGPRTPIARSTFCPITIALDDTRVFYVDSFAGVSGDFAVMSVPKEGGEPVRVTPSDGLAFAVHEGAVFAFDEGALVEVPLDGSARRVLVPHVEGAMGVAADAAHVYYTASDDTGALALRSVAR